MKLADIIDNGRSIEAHDPEFAKVWRREKVEMMAAMFGPQAVAEALARVVSPKGVGL